MKRHSSSHLRLSPLWLFLLAAAWASAAAQQATAGVSRELALSRAARISAVHYALQLTLMPHADTMPGREVLQFTLAAPTTASGSATSPASDLLLDYRDGELTSAEVNGQAISTQLEQGHLRLPAAALHAGGNTVTLAFQSRIAAAGAAITRYADKDDGSEYLYSLFVPMDASMAFPCFDQPDLKARFTLAVDTQSDWTIVSNTRASRMEAAGKNMLWTFPETQPISTYLFAFAAGTWEPVHATPGLPTVYVRRSQVQRAEPEIPQLQDITARGMAWLADYFQQPFPFPKYDIVLIPGFPFGGMEHAGATFLREDGVLFRSAPTASDRFGRDILTLHELTHQWFGDLVTMRWFDDLWLKEGFAQYMAYRAEDALQPGSEPWKHFYEDIKPLAYGIDETEGTTPIFQDIPNLKDAKSAYGAIVYQKAPAILKQLEFWLGADAFRGGLRLYLQQHAYANAQWSDLVEAFHTSSKKDVRTWADAWVLRRGMPEVTAAWTCSNGTLDALTLKQSDVLNHGFMWPISNEVALAYASGPPMVLRAEWNSASYAVPQAAGKPCPQYIFANAGDEAYGRFLLDATSEAGVRQSLLVQPPTNIVPLLRSQLWGALWDNVHVAASAPRGYVELALANLPHESDETLTRIQGAHATQAMHTYMTAAGRAALVPKLEAIASDRMRNAPTVGLRIVSFRTFVGVAETPNARTTLKELLASKVLVSGVELRPLDRWGMVGRLVAAGDPEAMSLVTAETARDHSGEGDKYAFGVLAGAPDAAVKQQYFAQYLLPPTDKAAKPEDWLTGSLRPFNVWNQTALTAPYMVRALDQLPEIKRDRKIFFLGAWLGAFFGGQVDAASLAAVRGWLAQPGLDPDLRRKVLEEADELDRTVRIRQRFPD